MKNIARTVMMVIVAGVMFASCSKKKTGVCYCKYVSGDKKEFDLTGLNRSMAQDSCNRLSSMANAFGGECDLK